jgi:anti-sigma factor RsiW
MVPCEFNSMLGRYHDGELSAGERPAFEAHLPGCVPCTSELGQLRSMTMTLRAEQMPRATREFVARLESLASNIEDMSILRFARRLTAVAAAILVAATIQWGLHAHPAPPVAKVASETIAFADQPKILDPDAATRDLGSDSSALTVDMGPIADAISGGHP